MRLSGSAKLMRQRAIAVALLLSAALAVAAVTISALGAGTGHARRSQRDPLGTAVRGLVGFVELYFGGGGHWG